MNTYELAHRFFHEPTARGEYARVNTSFSYYKYADGHETRRYYSYATCIAEIRTDKHGQQVLVISDNKYSHSTSKHLYELRRANPGLPVVDVPRVSDGFYYWGGRLEGNYDFGNRLRTISELTEKDLRQAANREFVNHFIDLYDNYIEHFDDMDAESKKLRRSAEVRKAIEIMLVKNAELLKRREHIASITEEEREANRVKRAEALQRRLEKFIGDGNTLDKIRAAYQLSYRQRWHGGGEMTKAIREYRNLLESQRDEQGRRLSYVWLEDDYARTSQHCAAPIEDVERLLRLWKRHQDMVGEHAGMYQVVERDEQHVKIGCHVIPAWNIELLCNKLNVA